METQPRLSAMEMVALSIAYYADADNEIARTIPEEVWDGLFDRGFLQSSRDITGEAQTSTKRAGFEALLAAIKDADRAAA